MTKQLFNKDGISVTGLCMNGIKFKVAWKKGSILMDNKRQAFVFAKFILGGQQ